MKGKIMLFLALVVGAIALIFFVNSMSSAPVKEKVVLKGSDTELQLSSNLVEAFIGKNPGSDISVTGGGSGVGIAALLNNEIDVANSSRPMDDKEMQQGKDKGLDIQQFIMAIDGLSIVVNPDNTIQKVSLDQLSKIYTGKITNWKQVGGKDAKISLYGRQSTSGTYTFFRSAVVKDDYSPTMLNMEGNEAIVSALVSDKNGIGYAGVGYVKDASDQPRTDIKVIPVSVSETSEAISPLDSEAVRTGEYPIARPIFQYLGHLPKKDSVLEKLLAFENSPEGQTEVTKSGFYQINQDQMQSNNQLLANIK